VIARARSAVDAQDLPQLTSAQEQLERTLQLFKGLASGWPTGEGES